MTEVAETEIEARAIVIELRASTAIIRLNRPAEKNQLSIATLAALDAAVSQLTMRADIQAIIFTGTDDVFASGANIRELRALRPETAVEFAQRGQNLFQKIADAPQLTVAAINGYCMGGGLDLALTCDLRCASQDAVFAHPGARLGIITGWGGTQRLPRLIGAARAIEMFTTAARLDSRRAYEIGLADYVSDDILEFAIRLANKLDV
jgi:enoyl-CoA hydratase/carnithine racemase